MTIFSLLNKIGANGIRLWQENGQLKIKAPKGALTKEIQDQIVSNKSEILRFLIEASSRKNIPELLPFNREEEDSQPLSFMQERLWVINQLSSDGRGYNVPVAFTFKGKLDIEILNKSFSLLLARHESLRTIFPDENGQATQVILDRWDFVFEWVDLSSVKIKKQKYAQAKNLCEIEALKAFNLAIGPLVRGQVLKISSQEHIIMINCHHMISDDWSVNILLEELFTVFDAISNGKKPKLPELPVQYLDYSLWQRKWLGEGEELHRQLAFWKQNLMGSPGTVDLVKDYPRPSIQNFEGASKEFTLDASLTEQLKNLAEKQGATLYMILLAIFKTLLYRYTSQEDICLGGVIANRRQEATHGLVGMFVNTLALRTSIEKEDTFNEVLNKVKITCGEAYEYQETPFDKIVDTVKSRRNLALNPLFQIMVSQNIPLNLPKDNLAPFHLDRHTSKFDMTVEFTETKNGLHSVIEYATALFKQRTIEGLINNYTTFCKAIVSNPNTKINEYVYLEKDERNQLLVDLNQTKMEYPDKKCYHQLFLEQVRIHPNKVAVVYEKEQLTYKQLYEKSHTIALYLQMLGVNPNTLVAICMERSLDMIVGLLGILQAGGAYVPLDPGYPDDRLAYMLEDSRAKICLTQSGLEKKATKLTRAAENINIIPIDSNWSTIEKNVSNLKKKNVELKENVNANHLAYVIYTSGSTGKPKGVMIQHRALVNFLLSMSVTPGITANDKLLAVTTYCFDIAGLEFYLPLIKGAQLRICRTEDSKDAEALKRIFNEHGTTIMQATPATWQLLFYSGWRNEEKIKILVGGEALSESLKKHFANTDSEAWNMYGPTETTIWSTLQLIKKDEDITIGYPIANTQVYILDSFNNLQPLGIPGELHIAGDGIAQGYLNRPELTKEKFVPNPFKSGTLMYKTGDRARWLYNNTIEYLGRIDRQVKIRGFRIEIGEIESFLGKFPSIKKCVVVDQGEGINKRLVAFYIAVATKGEAIFEIPSEELKKYLAQFLPEYMVPTTFVSLDSIPLTQNGKIDRIVLQQMELSLKKDQVYETPKGNESDLIDLWATVLQLNHKSIGVNDNFFDVGGNSISAVSLASSIEKATSIKFKPVDLFKYSTIRNISKYLQEKATFKKDETLQKQKTFNATEKKNVKEKASKPSEMPEYYEDSLAIVGISCNFPEANDHWHYWKNLVDGRESINLLKKEEAIKFGVSPEHLNNPEYIPLKPGMDGKEFFDPEFFQISSGNAALMDPQFRQLLLHSWKAVEDAGYRCDAIEKTSVFMSASNNFYQSLGARISSQAHVMENADEFVSWILSQGGTIPSMISYQLGLKGPSAFVHSNCSSSLTALYYAYQSLQSKDADYALVGAATLSAALNMGYLQMPGLNFSSDGHCKTFDAEADGMVDGEGVGVVLVKRAADAVRDGDHIYCVLRGVNINNDGSDKVGFYAPSVNGQASVIQNTLEKTGINPETISYVEAHGTGTALGDPIEVKAITEAFEKYTDKKQFCAIGSVKPNIGHLDTAAGLAGCIKLAMSLYYKKLPPLINYKNPNPQIDFKNSPFYVLDREQTWTEDQYPKRVALSSFGIGGTNGHVILEEFNRTNVVLDQTGNSNVFLVPLSAKREDVLLEYAENFLTFIDGKIQHEIRLEDLAYTLQIGRMEMNFRVVFIVKTIEELINELRAFVENKSSQGYLKAQVNNHKKSFESLEEDEDYLELIEHWFLKKKVRKLAQLWVNGTILDWKLSYNEQYPRRISLPSYPFAKVRCWIDPTIADEFSFAKDGALPLAGLHPLVHNNISDFSRQSYNSLFTGSEFFLMDHQISEQKIFPAVAYLEMARFAISQATSEQFSTSILELCNLVWLEPMIVDKETQAIINLSANESGHITYQIVSSTNEGFTIHCEGKAEFKDEPAAFPINIKQLFDQLTEGDLTTGDIYTMFEGIGTQYGPTFQAVKKVRKGTDQLVAELRLPIAAENSFDQFLLHPSLLDGALQTSNVLFNDLILNEEEDVLPFALESLRIISTCSRDTLVWVRLSEGSRPENKIIKLDIDLTDLDGNICVQMHGFSFRKITKNKNSIGNGEIQLATTVWQPNEIEISGLQSGANINESASTTQYVVLYELDEISLKALERLLPESQFIRIESSQNDIADRFNEVALVCFAQTQKIFRGKPKNRVSIQFVTNNNAVESIFTALSGMFQTASMENPIFYGQVIQIDEQTSAEKLAQLLLENQSKPQDLSIKYLQGKRNTLQWQPIGQNKNRPSLPFKDQGVYLITGGLGGLGVVFTKEIIKQVTSAHIIITGRSELSEIKKESLHILNSPGATIEYKQMDLNNLRQVKEVISSVFKSYNRFNGIFHCAGMISDSFILKKTPEEFTEVLMPKVKGTIHLDEACRDIDLDFMVLFSSDSALGSVGQADYATANAFMDRFATYRNQLIGKGQRFGKTLSINWPLWENGGMQIDKATLEMLKDNDETQALSTEKGIQTFYQSLALNCDHVLVSQEEVSLTKQPLFQHEELPPLTEDVMVSVSHSNVEEPLEQYNTHGNDPLEKTLEFLKKQFGELFKIPSNQIDPQLSLENYGIDSILAINITNKLEKTFGSLSKTLLFEYQTIQELAEYFLESFKEKIISLFAISENGVPKRTEKPKQLSETKVKPEHTSNKIAAKTFSVKSSNEVLSHSSSTTKNKTLANDELIAVVGVSGRYPESPNIETYWENLKMGKDCIVEIPKDRWDWKEYYTKDLTKDGHHYSNKGGFIEGHDEFDPKFFNISPKEAEKLDPQERLFLQHAWMAIEDAGYTKATLQIPHGRNLSGQVGVYVGVMYSEYQLYGAEISQQGKRMGFANSMADIANRVSFVLNVHGPSFTVDTMCSSSLTSIHLACQDLKQGRTDMAVAGGVNLNVHPNKYLLLSSGQYISTTGHCHSFGEGGDGYIPGEGVGAIILKRLSDAKESGDHIYGIIRGSALNHGGKVNGFTVPNPKAQAALISQVMEESNTDPRHISYIEAHGTGTALGDPIEISALTKAFGQNSHELSEQNREYGFCSIGSVKSNIGHCESAAGVAAITKVLLQMKYRKIVPSLHSKVLNPNIDFDKTPFIVNQDLKEWNKPLIDNQEIPRIAGISSFGAGGSNAHILIEEYPQEIDTTERNKQVVIPISARKPEQLKQKVLDLIQFIENQQVPIDLSSMAYTLQLGREPMEERLGLIVETIDELLKKLKTCLEILQETGDKHVEGVYHGQVRRNKESILVISQDEDMRETIDKWIARNKIEKLLDLWVKGLDVEWQKLYRDAKPKRMSLPTYPFAREKYWWNDKIEDGNLTLNQWVEKKIATAYIHPILHSNTSNLAQQSYSTVFTGKEIYVKDSHVEGQKILPSSAYLEMARAAIEHALPNKEEAVTVTLYDMVFAEAVLVTNNKQVDVSLFANDNENIDFEIYSNTANEETIHCQGHAVIGKQEVLPRLDLEQIKKLSDTTQIVSEINIPDPKANLNGYILHPYLVDAALEAAASLLAGFDQFYSYPTALGSVQIYAAYKKKMVVWARYSQEVTNIEEEIHLDIDLCDEDGTVCVQMQGIIYKTAFKEPVQHETIAFETSLLLKPKEIPILTYPNQAEISAPSETEPLVLARNSIKKPSNIALDRPDTLSKEFRSKSEKSLIVLSNATNGATNQLGTVLQSEFVRLYEYGQGVFEIQITKSILTNDLTKDILQAINVVHQNESTKVLIIRGEESGFLNGDGKQYNNAIQNNLYRAISSFPYPVIANMNANTGGVGFVLGSLCDFMICSEEANYAFTNIPEGLYPTVSVFNLFKERFGVVNAFDFMYISTKSTGKELKEKGWSFPILPKDEIDAYIKKMVLALVKKPQKSLRLLKNHLARQIQAAATELKENDAYVVVEDSNAIIKPKTIQISHSKNIDVQIHKNETLLVTLDPVTSDYSLNDFSADLKEVLDQVKQIASVNAIVLKNDNPEVFEKSNQEPSISSIEEYSQLILKTEIPFISILNSSSNGINWLLSLFSEHIVYNKDAAYSMIYTMQNPEIAKFSGVMICHRLGLSFGKEIMLSNTQYKGSELLHRYKVLTVVEKEKCLQTALDVAQRWAKWPSSIMMTFKQSNAFSIKEKLNKLAEINIKTEIFNPVSAPLTPVSLNSKVISAHADPDGMLMVKMEDREAKNMFSDALTQGIVKLFDHVDKTPSYKVVVLTGFDNYFASGGTKEDLIEIQQGKTKFTDTKFYHLPMKCKIPVIAAMQGHAIGAGWSYGMFADFNLFSAESKYLSPYMNFGFTPGAGATFILPEKLGYDLSRETFFTAQEIDGSVLKNRGIKSPVVSRKKVVSMAERLARQIAQYPREQLIAVKSQLTHYALFDVEKTYNNELDMHEETFVGQADTLEQIQNYFTGLNGESAHSVASSAKEKSTAPKVKNIPVPEGDSGISQHEILVSIKKFLAQELHLEANEIEDDMEFIDLGLDSITGVTWVRIINEKFQLSIEATKVYSYPTLVQFSEFLKDELVTNKAMISEQIIEKQLIAPNQSAIPKKVFSEPAKNIAPSKPIFSSSVTKNIKKFLAQELHMKENEIDDDMEFIDLGLDSITGVTWVRKINENYGISIEATKVYSYPTLNDFGKFIKDELEKQGTVPLESNNLAQEEDMREIPAEPPVAIPKLAISKVVPAAVVKKLESWRTRADSKIKSRFSSKSHLEPIAIIGMAGQFPKSKNLEEFWNNIAQGKDCIGKIPKTRWDLNTYYKEGNPEPGKTNCKWQGSLDEFDRFDPLFFNIAPAEAESMDPQQRLFLQTCWHTIESAGYKARKLSGSKCGVFVGSATGDYHLLSKELQLSAKGFTGTASSVLAARISYFLNLQGSCLTIDTACSSSLVAIATACDSLIAGDSNMALAGGVCVMATPNLHIKSAQSGMLSQDGKCYTFDNRANGFVPGEGVGVVMLKRLSDAQKDQDNILGLIKGWGVNQDGKTNGITAPSPESQKRLMHDIYSKFEIDPNNIQLIEAHGTGTKLGDPIEVSALVESFSKYGKRENYCAIGSVKSNIGHTMAAAGVAGVLKVVLSLKNKKLPPTINFERLNEHIRLKGSPFYVNDRLKDWNSSEKRQAAVSSFGFSGTNAHLVIAEYQTGTKSIITATQSPQIIIPLSARNFERLQQKAKQLLHYLKQNKTVNLNEMAYTLQAGREEMEERLGFLVKDIKELTHILRAYVDGNDPIEGVYYGQVNHHNEGIQFINQDNEIQNTLIDKWLSNQQMHKLLEGWVKGLAFDWDRLYGKVKPRRIELPLYPFAKEHYWITKESNSTLDTSSKNSFFIHPLLHQNTSNFSQQRYTSTFSGDELYLKDHQIQLDKKGGVQKVLPGVAYLEMARAAVVDAMLLNSGDAVMELCNIIWVRPMVVSELKQVSIGLLIRDDMQIDFEIYGEENGSKVEYCQGQVLIKDSYTIDQIDVSQLETEMQVGQINAEYTYKRLKKMGFHYGPAHQAVKVIHQGENQALAELILPEIVESNNQAKNFILHPSIMDCALQASIGLTENVSSSSNQPSIPFALDYIRILSPCKKSMYSWVRYSSKSGSNGTLTKLDIDLIDGEGTVCVQLEGLTSRVLTGDEKQNYQNITKELAGSNSRENEYNATFEEAHYETILNNILDKEVSVDEAVNMED